MQGFLWKENGQNKMNRLNIIITNIHRALGSQRPLMVEITLFNQLGAEQLKTVIPATMCIGDLEVGQELVLAPKEQAIVKLKAI